MNNVRRGRSAFLMVGALIVAWMVPAVGDGAMPPLSTNPAVSNSQVSASFMKFPLNFEANHGQTDRSVNFIARGSAYTLFLTPTESVMVLQQRQGTGSAADQNDFKAMTELTPVKQSVVRMKLEGANPTPSVEGLEKLPGIVNYFIGNDREKWRTKIPTYAKVHYKDAYSGIDVAYYGKQGRLEYDFIVSPGADPNQIKLAFEGASDIRVAESGDLLITTALGEVRMQKPVVYQLEKDEHKTLIAGNYIVSPSKPQTSTIQVAAYDPRKPLIIDPVVDYLTYLGGKENDGNTRIAVDTLGNAYVSGLTKSLDFPATSGAFDTSFNANPICPGITATNTDCPDPLVPSVDLNIDRFVAKINPTAAATMYVTYVGGTGNEGGFSPIAVDSSGNAYIAGQTRSTDFPVTPGAFQTSLHHGPSCLPSSNCGADGFVTKLDSTGSSLVYSTYFGGSTGDGVHGLRVDTAGFAYVTGDFSSGDFPITPGAFSSVFGRGLLAKLNQTGTALVWSTRMGLAGSGFHEGQAIALDSGGNVIVIGGTQTATMPIVGAIQPAYGGNSDAFLWKFSSTGTTLMFSTFLGGSGVDWGYGVAVDASNNIYVTGYTQSPNFPTTAGAYDQTHNGDSDIFVAKLPSNGAPLTYSTFLGGSANEENRSDVVVDAAGQAHVSANSVSSDFPLVNAFDTTRASGEIVVAKLTADGSNLVYSSFLGGQFSENRPSIALGPGGTLYVAAMVNPTGLTTTPGVFQPNSNGGEEVFIAKITDKPIANAGPDQSVPEGTMVTLDATGSTAGNPNYNWTQVGGPPVSLANSASAHPTFTAPHVPPAGATLTFELIVCEGTSATNCSDPDSINVHVTNINQPPVSDAGPDQTVQESSPVVLDGSGSFDPDVETFGYHWTQILGPAVTLSGASTVSSSFVAPNVGPAGATLVFDLTVTDPHTLTGSDSVSIHISNVNQTPVANAGTDQTVNEQTGVTLNGTGSSDPDLDTLHFTWSQTGGPGVALTGATSVSPTFTAPSVGVGGANLTFSLVVSDGQATSAADTVLVHVQDTNDPPVCALAHPSLTSLWPPNHSMVPVNILGITDPNDQNITITFPAITQDEPVNGLGDGDTTPDAAVVGSQVLLRAERAGGGNGRVYVVHFTATDAHGASCNGTVKVGVPHSKKDTAVEGPQLYNSFGP